VCPDPIHRRIGWRWPLATVPPALRRAARSLLSGLPGRAYAPDIVGGQGALQGQLGFMAFIMYSDSSDTPVFSCSGTLVSSNVVLTAGHCAVDESTGVPFDPSRYRVVTGPVDWTDTADRR
jgi:hypothetical protein